MENRKNEIRQKFYELLNAIIYTLKEYWWYSFVVIFLVYGLIVLFKGISAGVYITSQESLFYFLNQFVAWVQEDKCIPVSTNSYDISFFASAEQDYWFFLIIGLAVSIPSIRNPKTDGIRTKVSHFFPTLSESSPHMEEIITLMNKASCVAKKFHREMVITEIEDDLFKAIINTKFTLKNLHHNHSLDYNIGNFRISPDESAKLKHPTWGALINFTDEKGNIICHPNRMSGPGFKVENYNIELDANEEREYNCNYTIWFDKKEPLSVSFIRFTEAATFQVLNQTSQDVHTTIKVLKKGTETIKVDKVTLQEGDTASPTENIKYLSDTDKVIIEIDY